MVAAIDVADPRLPQDPRRRVPAFGPAPERRAQMAVLVHPAERLVVVGLELEPAGLEPVGDRDAADRATRLGQMIGDPDRLEHAHRARRYRAGPAVERGAGPLLGVGGINDDRRHAAGVERRGEREPDQPAAEDDHVRAVHRARP